MALGTFGFTGGFYKVFWCLLKMLDLGEMHEIFKKKELPIAVRLGVIALIPKGNRDKRNVSNW